MDLRFSDVFRGSGALERATGWDDQANATPAYAESGRAITYDDSTDMLLPTGQVTQAEWFGTNGRPGLREQVLAQGVMASDIGRIDRRMNRLTGPDSPLNLTARDWRHVGAQLHNSLQRFENGVVLRRPEDRMTADAEGSRWSARVPSGPIPPESLQAGQSVHGFEDPDWHTPARLAHALSVLTGEPRGEMVDAIFANAAAENPTAEVAWDQVRDLLDDAGFEGMTLDQAVRQRQQELGVFPDGRIGRRTTTAQRAVDRIADAVRDSEAIQDLLGVQADASLADVRELTPMLREFYSRWADRTEGVTNAELENASPAQLAAFTRALEEDGFAGQHPQVPPSSTEYSSAAVNSTAGANGDTTVPGAQVMVPGFQHISQMSSRGGESGSSLYCYRAVMAMAHEVFGNAENDWSSYAPAGSHGVRNGLGSARSFGDHDWIREQLEAGHPILLGVDRPGGRNLGIGGADHATMIVGIDEAGNYIVADPGSSSNPMFLMNASGRQLDADGQPNGRYTARNVIPFNVGVMSS